MQADTDCRGLGKHDPAKVRPVCGLCYNMLLRKWRQEVTAREAAVVQVARLEHELADIRKGLAEAIELLEAQ